jgi:hypothetical protein
VLPVSGVPVPVSFDVLPPESFTPPLSTPVVVPASVSVVVLSLELQAVRAAAMKQAAARVVVRLIM